MDCFFLSFCYSPNHSKSMRLDLSGITARDYLNRLNEKRNVTTFFRCSFNIIVSKVSRACQKLFFIQGMILKFFSSLTYEYWRNLLAQPFDVQVSVKKMKFTFFLWDQGYHFDTTHFCRLVQDKLVMQLQVLGFADNQAF